VRLEYRWAEGDPNRAAKMAAELVEWQPDAIFCQTSMATAALRGATRTIPIVFTQVSDPVGFGFVSSWSHPGGNATGFTNFEATMGGKWLELIKEILPSAAHAGLMFNPAASRHIASGFYIHSAEKASEQMGMQASAIAVNDAQEIEKAIADFGGRPNSALIVLPDTFTLGFADLIIRLTAQHRLPTIYAFRVFATRGGLVSYGINPLEQYPRAASYIDRILHGEKPESLPVQASTKFELVVNLKMAKALGLTIPESFLLRADEVIE
jgi:ABC-type uncharacterized transport system substrate-binding protein